MAVKIRLKRMGKIRAPHYRIVVADARTRRDGRVIEEIGKYHPKEDPSFIEVDTDRAQYWLGVGAQPSEPVAAILKVTGDWQKFRGEAAPAPMKVAKPRRDKTEAFNEALKDSTQEPQTEAVTAKRAAAKTTVAASKAPSEGVNEAEAGDKAEVGDKAAVADDTAAAVAVSDQKPSGQTPDVTRSGPGEPTSTGSGEPAPASDAPAGADTSDVPEQPDSSGEPAPASDAPAGADTSDVSSTSPEEPESDAPVADEPGSDAAGADEKSEA